MQNKNAQTVLSIATGALAALKINPSEGQKTIATGLSEIRQLKAQTKREDLAEFCDKSAHFLESMARHGKYQTAFAGTLEALGRAGAMVREDVADLADANQG